MLPSFYGLTNEDPYRHLDEFLEICSTVKIQHFSDDALRLKLFPFSLKDRAKYWLNSIDTITISTWEQLQREFLKKYFPIGKTNQIRKAITSFSQADGEMFHETLERLKDLTRKCPHHAIPKWQLVQCFYDGLSERHRQMVDASCGGTFMLKKWTWGMAALWDPKWKLPAPYVCCSKRLSQCTQEGWHLWSRSCYRCL